MDSDLKTRTKRFSINVIKYCKHLDFDYISQTIAKQLLISGNSVGANTRAAFRGRSNKEFIAKIGIVIEETSVYIGWN
jgi:four helix bundle protein